MPVVDGHRHGRCENSVVQRGWEVAHCNSYIADLKRFISILEQVQMQRNELVTGCGRGCGRGCEGYGVQASVNPKAETVEELQGRRKALHMGMLKLAREDLALVLQAAHDAYLVPASPPPPSFADDVLVRDPHSG